VTVQKFTIGIVNRDEGPLGKILADEVFAKGLREQVRVKYYEEDEMKKKMKDHTLSVGLVLDSNFSLALFSGKKADVKLYTMPNPGVKAMIVESVIQQFSQTVILETEAKKLAAVRSSAAGLNYQTGQGSAQEFVARAQQQAKRTWLNEQAIAADQKPVGSFQYYAAAMGVMFLLMTVVEGVSAMILEKEQEVYKRLLVSKLTFSQYLAGKMAGLIMICLTQSFVIIGGTSLLFDVDWGESSAGVALMTFAFVISASGLGVLAGSFIHKEKTFNAVGMIGTQIMAAIGGSMAPIYIFPDWMVSATKVLPNGLALQSYIDLMSGASFTDILPEASGGLALGACFFAIGLFRLSRERRESYA
jgi:ABC-2 type transport system permease protein